MESKVRETKSLKDFRLISICNNCYKIVLHEITNRFWHVLTQVVDTYHTAFIPSRLIMDNVIEGF